MKTGKKIVFAATIATLMGLAANVNAQSYKEWAAKEEAEKQAFIENEKKSFQQFVKERDEEIRKMDEEFKEFLKQEWKNYDSKEVDYKPDAPKPAEIPVYKEEPKQTQAMQIEVQEKVESFAEAPKLPVMSKSDADGFKASTAKFNFYGNNVSVRYDNAAAVRIGSINEQSISDAWDKLSKTNYSCTLNDLLQWHSELNMNDWGLYLLIKQAAASITDNQNSRVLLTWFMLTKANYKARLAYKGNNLYLLLAAANNIYGMPFFTFENQRYYMLDGKSSSVYTYSQDFPEARSIVDLNIYKPLNGNEQLKKRNLDFEYDGQKYQFGIKYDQNTINFYNDYPQADIKIYFDATVSRATKESLVESLVPVIGGMDAVDATEFLLKFVQSFAYKTDDQQFGHEKFFFPDEMFYYPYSDCEDRAVLFAYLVKQLVGLDVIGLNYPGHMAAAVCFNSDVPGNYLEHNGRRFVVCDPTYIGASIGQAMPQYKKVAAKIVENASQPNLASRAVKLWKIANKYGLHQGDNKHNIVFDGKGDAYMCGYFNGNVEFMGRQLSAEGTDVFVTKITADNEVDFLYRIGSKSDDVAYNIVLGDDDSFYFSGSFNGEMTVGSKKLKTDKSDFFIAKCSRDGQMEWINQANIGHLDSINNTFAAQFDNKGNRLWTRTYAESEDMSDYGIHIDKNGNPFLTGSMLAAVGLSSKSYEAIANAKKSTFAVSGMSATDESIAPEIAGLIAAVERLNMTQGSMPGNEVQNTISGQDPEASKRAVGVYDALANVEFIRNGQGIVTVRTMDGNPIDFNTIKLANNSKFKMSIYNTGNVQIDFLSGSQYGGKRIWYGLNCIKLHKTSGNMTFDYDINHTCKTINVNELASDNLN